MASLGNSIVKQPICWASSEDTRGRCMFSGYVRHTKLQRFVHDSTSLKLQAVCSQNCCSTRVGPSSLPRRISRSGSCVYVGAVGPRSGEQQWHFLISGIIAHI